MGKYASARETLEFSGGQLDRVCAWLFNADIKTEFDRRLILKFTKAAARARAENKRRRADG